MDLKSSFRNLLGGYKTNLAKPTKKIKPQSVQVPQSGGRSSEVGSDVSEIQNAILLLDGFVDFSTIQSIIPEIRKLIWRNSDLGSALNDLVTLSNTGFKVVFDPSVDYETADMMKAHLNIVQKKWGDGSAGIHTIINKLFAQSFIAGAISAEIIPELDLSGINNIVTIPAENIIYKLDNVTKRYMPYQKPLKTLTINNLKTQNIVGEYIPLNPLTYKYYNTSTCADLEIPYGIPPVLGALEPLKDQREMNKNISFILRQLGLMGFFETKLEKPQQNATENTMQYEARLNKLLSDTKNNLVKGINDGVVVGFKDDHEFDFHSTTNNINGVKEIFDNNENQIANGIKFASVFLGVSGVGGTETSISVVFTKLIAQLKNTQITVASFLEDVFRMELLLAGFNFNYLKVEFNPSTLVDTLKYWQAREIQQRVLRVLYSDGIIGQDKYAEEMGYEKADLEEPRVPIDGNQIIQDTIDKNKREASKDKSDKTNRDKNKPVPKNK